MSQGQDWTFHGFAGEFDGHVREQLPWYELASAAMGLIARQYIPKNGKVYDLGASTGNVGRVLAHTLEARGARLTALDECPDMVEAYNAPGRALRADITRFDYKPFDVAVAVCGSSYAPAGPSLSLTSWCRRAAILPRFWQG